jgi:hypothetical protein
MVEWEARQIVAPRSRDDVLIDHTPLRQNPVTGEVEVLLVAAKKDLVGQYTKVVQDAGLRPVVVDATAFTLQNCVEASLGFTSGETVAVVNVGATASTICIIVEGMPAYGRDLSSGGHSYTEALVRSLRSRPRRPNASSAASSQPADPALFERTMLQVSEAIAAEGAALARLLPRAAAEAAPARIVLAGGARWCRRCGPRWPSARACRSCCSTRSRGSRSIRSASTSRRCGPAPRSRRSRSAWRCAQEATRRDPHQPVAAVGKAAPPTAAGPRARRQDDRLTLHVTLVVRE